MPISEAALQNPKNRFLAVKGDASVGQAFGALQGEGGQQWWHLVVQMDDGSWRVTRFSDLYVALKDRADAADLRLGSWDSLIETTAVERDSIDTRAAESLAKKGASRVLVVTVDGSPVGLLVEGVTRGGPSISSAKLGELGGKHINLSDYGSILLSSSKRVKPSVLGNDPKVR
jgi:hypothetical protein